MAPNSLNGWQTLIYTSKKVDSMEYEAYEGDEGVLKQIVVVIAQLWECAKNFESFLKWWFLEYTDCVSVKILKTEEEGIL